MRAIRGLLPVGSNDLAVLTKRAVEALRKTRELPPQCPDPAAVGHPVDPRDTARIVVEHAIGFRLIVRTHDRGADRKVRMSNLRMLNQVGSSLQPGERAVTPHDGRRVRVKGHIRDLYVPLPDKRRQLLEGSVGFERRLWILVRHQAPLKCMENSLH